MIQVGHGLAARQVEAITSPAFRKALEENPCHPDRLRTSRSFDGAVILAGVRRHAECPPFRKNQRYPANKQPIGLPLAVRGNAK